MNQLDRPITFLLADDHSLIRQGIVFLLEEMELECEIFHASTLQKILESIQSNPIDIAIIDAHFPDGNSLSILSDIKNIRPEIKILIFSGIDENTQSLKFINAGANGFLSKLSEEEDVKYAISKMIKTGEYISPVTQALLMNSIRNRNLINPLFSLTDRELQIAEMYAEGYGNLEIANKLDIKQNTVSTLKKRIFEKLNIENIVELIELIKNHY
ncbi:DNA-binding NarL/FixJ family response regulator [Epilithonimonas hungarica]|jgi:Response regulator containing a CheY-like receiver domain and an HTH DNA-binding domain|uniref:response regulator transcription factor n=1 Tax=Epilithonimonas hungarica TaxID=454006 RepID=UPI0012BE0DA9|nr:response regulator transcription factor [Epilithonimonas hungarica]MDP9956105.1 DNA-binding NarL/FixJ family response regulator [Epilithonimonas hungarica]MPT32635.1 response regulator transcription factor [Chryseobacterium sp.]